MMVIRAAILCSAIFGLFLLFHNVDSSPGNRVITLDEDNWEQMLTGEWMVKFYAPWCPACRTLQPMWADFSGWSDELDLKVAQVDVTKSPGLSGRFMVTALPTIYHVNNGEFRQYRDTRDPDTFFKFVEQKKWKDVDPLPYWKSPDSIQMSLISKFFKLSQILRSVHVHLMNEYGLPTWGSYLIFAVATILLGALLGLLVVCIIDRIYPSKPEGQAESKSSNKTSGDEADEDMELLKDDLIDEEGSQESTGASSGSSGGSSAEEDKSRSTPSTPGTPGTPGKARQRRPRKTD